MASASEGGQQSKPFQAAHIRLGRRFQGHAPARYAIDFKQVVEESLGQIATDPFRGTVRRVGRGVFWGQPHALGHIPEGLEDDNGQKLGLIAVGRLGGAALDVSAEEPINPANPVLNAVGDKLLLTPHVAGVTQEAQGRIITMTNENIVAVMKGGSPVNLIN